ncbi:MAG: dTDP-4-dehydrorhamnose reductase [Firmicutes bacterium ADurb.Bin419]|nr:MAG: dTDP-4-dehydrorhamnose reductase [Firmicutes bacterium ADurb.Bin419]
MKLIVIGASGFIGSHVYSLSKKVGYDVVGTYTSKYSNGLLKYDLLTDNIFEKIPEFFIDKSDKVVAVICSAITKIDFCQQQKELSYNINVKSTISLVEKLSEQNIKTVFLSTDNVFDGERGYYDESDEANPINEYGSQKFEAERYILSKIPESLVLRLSKIVGDDPSEEHIFSELYRRVSDSICLDCIEGQIFSPTYVDDVVKGILISLEKGLTGLYHLSNSEYFSRAELARQFLNVANIHGEVVEKPLNCFKFLDNRPMKTYLDGSKFVKNTGMNFMPIKEVISRFSNPIKI